MRTAIHGWISIAEKVLNGSIDGMRYVDENGELKTVSFAPFNRSFSAPQHYLWLIPLQEVNLLGISQNEGY